MINKDTGGSAFPAKKRIYRQGYATQEFEPVEGMSIRDYFAAKAMQKFIMDEAILNTSDTSKAWLKSIADASYEMADAMIKAKESK